MHFYPFNIGDYATATAHLEPLEDIAYRRLMDLYYSTEKPIPECLDKVARLIRMRTHSECIAIVLDEFFTLEGDGYHCDRIDMELFKYKEKSNKARDSAKTRWKKAKKVQKVKASCERNANALQTQCDGNAKQELRTKKQEPRNKKQETDIKPLIEPEKTVRPEVDQKALDKLARVRSIDDAFVYFWANMKLKKSSKTQSVRAFKKALAKIDEPMRFAEYLVTDTVARFNNQQLGFDNLHPSTYLNNNRWEDEYTIDIKKTKPEKVKASDGGDFMKYQDDSL